MSKTALLSVLSLGMLTGCMTPVEDLKPTSFDSALLNKNSEGRVVTILHLMPAKAHVNNEYNHRKAENIGMLSGAVLCGAIGGSLGGAFAGTAGGLGAGLGGAFLCGLAGRAIGAAIEPPELHPQSLIVVFQDPNVPKLQQTVEIARACEFKPGSAYAVIVKNPKTGRVETRIQPNNFEACLRKIDFKKEDRKLRKAAQKAIRQKHAKGEQTTEAEDAYKKNITAPTRLENDGTVILNGTYLGVMRLVNESVKEGMNKMLQVTGGGEEMKLKTYGDGDVKTLDDRRAVRIVHNSRKMLSAGEAQTDTTPEEALLDGTVRDITDPQHPRIIGHIDPEQFDQFIACSKGLESCHVDTF